MSNHYLCSNLKYLRFKCGYNQKDLAEKLFVSNKTISKWELGNSEPSFEMLQNICTIFDVTIDEILHTDLSHSQPIALTDKKITKLHIKSILTCNIIIFIAYMLSIAAYLIFSDPVFISQHGYDGKWIGIGIYASFTILASIVLCVLLIADSYALHRYPSESGRRNWFRCVCGSVWMILFTLSATFLGGYNASDIRAHLVQSFANIFLSAWLLLWIISEFYAVRIYRKYTNFVGIRSRVSLLQIPYLALLVALTAVHLNPEDFTKAQFYITLALCYSFTLAYGVLNTIIYLKIKRISCSVDIQYMLIRNILSLLILLFLPITIAKQTYGWQVCIAGILLIVEIIYAFCSAKQMYYAYICPETS